MLTETCMQQSTTKVQSGTVQSTEAQNLLFQRKHLGNLFYI